MRTIAIINQKGGCGKTTTAINLGAMLARRGRRVLLVDMDPQSHCAAGLGIPEARLELDIGDAMLTVGTRPLDVPRLLWRVGRNLDLAPSRMKLAGLESARGGLADLLDRERRLASVLQEFKHEYDVVCIDCPPSIGLLTYNALAASDHVLIPVETSFFSLQGATKQVQTVRTLSRRLGVQLPVWVVPTIHEAENAVAGDLLDELHRRFKDRVCPVVIRRDSALREAASHGQPVGDYAPDSAGASDYAALARWIVERVEGLADAGDDAIESHDEPATPEVHVSPISARVMAGMGARAGAEPMGAELASVETQADVKPVTRAEDVARRAQEFLRRVATGGTRAAATTGESPASSPAAVATLAPPAIAAPARETTEQPAGILRLVAEDAPSPPVPVRVRPDATRLLGVRLTNQGVLFVQPLSVGREAAVAGTFNNWSASAHPMRRNEAMGVYELCLRLPPGTHRYRLVLDGQWTADPHNDRCEPNPFGEADSLVDVPSVPPQGA